MTDLTCANELNMIELIQLLESKLNERGEYSLLALNPDHHPNCYNGERVEVGGRSMNMITLKAWTDLAEVCSAKLKVPKVKDHFLELTFKSLNKIESWHDDHPKGNEKYGSASRYSKVHKNFDPHFIKDYDEALGRCHLSQEASVLNFGVNRGDEFDIFNTPKYQSLKVRKFGLDYSKSALLSSEQEQLKTICADVENLPLREEKSFDLFVSINTLHGSQFDGKSVFRYVFQKLLKKEGSVILGFPNCRYLDGEVIYGGKMKNFSRHDFSILLKDLQYYKKYLQSHKRKVYLTGKYTLFVTAVPI